MRPHSPVLKSVLLKLSGQQNDRVKKPILTKASQSYGKKTKSWVFFVAT